MKFEHSPEYKPCRDAIEDILLGNFVADFEEIHETCQKNYMQSNSIYSLDNPDLEGTYHLRFAAYAENQILNGADPKFMYGLLGGVKYAKDLREIHRSLLEIVIKSSKVINLSKKNLRN